ncbi:hypothetical protein LR48_Vigan618s000700 [Vigna angularis]|uniref:Uncharacterized protein n=1 Tax=Phaseolus angularis TaxID=3914 RepID=A0A0L9TE89_PHAAN|nr:hypothetical protein LR48_Vigan618s000700 [Vigna angularis]
MKLTDQKCHGKVSRPLIPPRTRGSPTSTPFTLRHRDELLTPDDVPPRALQAGQTVIVEQPIGVLANVLVQVGDSMPGSRTLRGFGICIGEASNICCHRVDAGCDGDDGFKDLEAVRFGFGNVSLDKGKSRSFCKHECLGDCGCVGLSFEKHSGVPSGGLGRKVFDWKVLSGVVIGSIVVLGVVVVTLLVMVKRRVERKKLEEDEKDGFLDEKLRQPVIH